MIKLNPREYQKAIFETAKNNNTLVVIPTGLGKTLIALLLAVERQKKFPGSKAVITAPTRPLVEQHYDSFKEQLPDLFAELTLFTGSIKASERRKLFERADIIFSTPQCIANDLKAGLYSLKDVSFLVIDEAHRCLKNYSYTSVVNYYKSQSENRLILGLTASPGYEEKKVKEICEHLDIREIEVRTRESDDVKKYLQELEFEKVDVEFPKEFLEIRVLLKMLFDRAVEQLKGRNLLFGPANKISLLQLQGKLAKRMAMKDFNAIAGMSLTAQAIKVSHAMELLETQTLSGLENYLEGLKQQAEEKKSKAVQYLIEKGEFKAAFFSLRKLREKGVEHPKIDKIVSIVEEQFKEEKKPKIIVFSQYRESAQRIAGFLNKSKGIKSEVFIGQSIKKDSHGQSGLNQKMQKAVVERFRRGEIDILCATSIGEEGLDIPEVSCVIFYEPIPSAIRKIQRAGRTARLSKGKLIILVTKDTRDEIHHYASSSREKKMHKILLNVRESLRKRPKTLRDFE